jgi:hypothetical protein
MNATQPGDNRSQHGQTDEERPGFRVPPGAIVVILGVILLSVIIAGVVLNASSEGDIERVTIAQLRADPDRWDNRSVIVAGGAEDVRELPYLSQYAIYSFRDETGSMLALTRKGAPPDGDDQQVELQAIYHSKVTLDDELKEIVEDQLGPLAGSLVDLLVPGVPLDVVFLEHERYAPVESTAPTEPAAATFSHRQSDISLWSNS